MSARTKKTGDLAEYFQKHRDDLDEWEETPEAAVVEKGSSIVYSFRLKPSELAELRRAASVKRIALSELVRTSALQHIRESDVAGVDVSAPKFKFFGRSAPPSAGTKGPHSPFETLANVTVTAVA